MKRKYEIGFIINPESSEEEVKKIIDSIVEIIQKNEGTIENIDEWGRRPMAYAVEKHNEGIYTFINAEMPGNTFFDIEKRMKVSEKVMRYIILRLDDRLRKANKLTKKWQRMERISKKSADDEKDEGLRRRPPQSRKDRQERQDRQKKHVRDDTRAKAEDKGIEKTNKGEEKVQEQEVKDE
ncbi:MAG: 30S ribosomal protein S6 [Candidatus Aminicenantes bacterium]|nr:30S ribosomal protein S6 [Candidatus Aminicenantes bacterium]